jgi:hypothetical protein
VAYGLDWQSQGLLGVAQTQAGLTNRLKVLAAGDEDDIDAAKEELAADDAADAAGSVNDVSHSLPPLVSFRV